MKSIPFIPSSLAKALTPWHFISATALVALTVLGSQPAQAVMLDIGSLQNGAAGLAVKGISGNGEVVVGLAGGDPSYWSATTGFQTIPDIFPRYWRNAANGVSANGQFVVGTSWGLAGGVAVGRAFRWDIAANTELDLGSLGGLASDAYGISDNGEVVVGTADTSTATVYFGRAFRWEGGAMTDLGVLRAGDISVARGVSGDGQVVVGYSTNATLGANGYGVEDLTTSKAFRWDTATTTMVDLGSLGGASQAFATNSDGSVTVGRSELAGNSHAVIWTAPNALLDLATLGGLSSSAADVNADGSVVVGSSQINSGENRAFRWTNMTGMVNLGVLTGETNSFATGVSDDGNTVVGNSGNRAFIWTPDSPAIQDLSYLQTSIIRSTNTVNHLVAAQTRRLRDLAQQQCLPDASQTFCLGVGGSRDRADGNTNGNQHNLNLATGLRVNPHFSVGANGTVGRADLREQGAQQRNTFGLSLWGAVQENVDATGWNASTSMALGDSANRFERGTGLADVQRARAKLGLSSRVVRAAVNYGFKIDDSVLSPELALSHGRTTQNGFTERNVALPLTVESSVSREAIVTVSVRSATAVSPQGTLHLSLAADALLSEDSHALEGRSAVPGLGRFKLDSSLDKRRVVPVATAGYSHALDANSTVGGGVQMAQSRYAGERPLFGLGVQYRYSF